MSYQVRNRNYKDHVVGFREEQIHFNNESIGGVEHVDNYIALLDLNFYEPVSKEVYEDILKNRDMLHKAEVKEVIKEYLPTKADDTPSEIKPSIDNPSVVTNIIPEEKAPDFSAMTIKQLVQYAEEHNIKNVNANAKKQDIIDIILKA